MTIRTWTVNATRIATPHNRAATINLRVLMVRQGYRSGTAALQSATASPDRPRGEQPMRDALGAVQSVLVLGGASDIAVATVEKLAADRVRTVVLAGRDTAKLEAAAERVRAAGATTVDIVAFDAADTETHEQLIDGIWADHPDLDAVLLAFGRLGDQERFDENPADGARIAVTNYAGAVSSGLAVARRLKEQGHGTLVVMSSVAGERTRADNFVYGSTKAGLDAFAQGLGDRLAGTGASVMVVRPGFVRTSMTEGMEDGPMATTAEAVADDIVTGLRKGAHTVWSPAKLRPVFGVLKLLPRPLWRRIAAAR